MAVSGDLPTNSEVLARQLLRSKLYSCVSHWVGRWAEFETSGASWLAKFFLFSLAGFLRGGGSRGGFQ